MNQNFTWTNPSSKHETLQAADARWKTRRTVDVMRPPMPGYFGEGEPRSTDLHQALIDRRQSLASPQVRYPWGINPVIVRSPDRIEVLKTPLIPREASLRDEARRDRSRYSNVYRLDDTLAGDIPEVHSTTTLEQGQVISQSASLPSPTLAQEDLCQDQEYVQTSGFDTFVELLRSFYDALVGNVSNRGTTPPYPDIEQGVASVTEDGQSEITHSIMTSSTGPVFSFPSSVDQLIPKAPSGSIRVYPAPCGTAPHIPSLPTIRLRNSDD